MRFLVTTITNDCTDVKAITERFDKGTEVYKLAIEACEMMAGGDFVDSSITDTVLATDYMNNRNYLY